MNIILTVVAIFLVAQNVDSYNIRRNLNEIRETCKQLCSGCGGKLQLDEDRCICTIESQDESTKPCLAAAKRRANWLNLGWSEKYGEDRTKRSTDRHNHVVKKIVRRNTSPYLDGYGSPVALYQGNPEDHQWPITNYNPNNFELPTILDSNRGPSKFTAPYEDDALEIEHQFIFENDDGDASMNQYYNDDYYSSNWDRPNNWQQPYYSPQRPFSPSLHQ